MLRKKARRKGLSGCIQSGIDGRYLGAQNDGQPARASSASPELVFAGRMVLSVGQAVGIASARHPDKGD